MRESLEEQILDYLKKMRVGATASELSRKLNINRMTAVKYLEVMRATGLVDYKNVGMAKVYYVSTEFSYAQHVLLLKTSSGEFKDPRRTSHYLGKYSGVP